MKYLLFLMLLAVTPTYALSVDGQLPEAAQEARAQALFRELRCVVCEGESISDSPAEVARDMRRAVRGEVLAGKSDEEIKAMLVTQYGERVLMKPPFAEHWLLWLAPLIGLLAGGWLAWKYLFRGRA